MKRSAKHLKGEVGQNTWLNDPLDHLIDIFITLLTPELPIIHVDHFLFAAPTRVVAVRFD